MSDPSPSSPLDVDLIVEPQRVRMSDLDAVQVGLTATNTSDDDIHPHLFAARLLVNDEFSPCSTSSSATG